VNLILWAEYWCNTLFQGCTSFEIVYGRAPPSLAKFVPGEIVMEAIAQDLMIRDKALKISFGKSSRTNG